MAHTPGDLSAEPPPDEAVERLQRRTLGESDLGQAIDALRASGASDTLYRQAKMPENVPDQQKAMVLVALTVGARVRRVEFARSTILYCILAAEAYANQYLGWHLKAREFQAVDRWPTLDKYLLGPRLVVGHDLFKRGEEPIQSLGKLLALRTRLVHPKLRPKPPLLRADEDPPDFEAFNPCDSARYLVAVAEAVVTLLVAGRQTPYFDPVVGVIAADRSFLLQFGEAATRELPRFGAEPAAPDLMLDWVRRREPRA